MSVRAGEIIAQAAARFEELPHGRRALQAKGERDG